MTSTSIESLLATKEIVVCCGSGGVGKTTVAASAALGAASRLGGKVLVLTIDPAKRLADALGLEGIGNIEKQVPVEAFKAAGLEVRGELWAAMLDTKQSWDALVLRHAPDEETAYKILDNRMYENITARFVQSHDYIAMERLFEIHETGKFDLIIVDTPPTRNALDFLDAPKRMAEFFGGRLLRWLTMPYRVGGRRGARMINVASRPFYQMADRLLGSQFLQDIAEFFLNFQSMYGGFVERANAVERLLHDKRTTFAVVTTLESAPLHEAEYFCEQLTKPRLPPRCSGPEPHAAALPVVRRRATAPRRPCARSRARSARRSPRPGTPPLADPARDARVLTTIGHSFQNFAVVAKREAELRSELSRVPEVLADVPALDSDVGDISGLAVIADSLFPKP